MRKNEYKKKRAELEHEKDSLSASLAKVEQTLLALDLVWTEVFNSGQSADEETPSATAAVESDIMSKPDGEHVTVLIGQVAQEMEGAFGVKEIESRIKDRRPELSLNRSTIAGKLKRMADDGWLTIIVEGAGRRPTTYQRKTGPLVLTAC